jgi:hypothetical protein
MILLDNIYGAGDTDVAGTAENRMFFPQFRNGYHPA